MTMDALHTQRDTAQTILDGGGEYVMIAKGNQPSLLTDLRTVRREASQPPDAAATAETTGVGHGRTEYRRLTVITPVPGCVDWPGREQAFRVERRILLNSTGELRCEVVYGVTSLDTSETDPARLLRYVRHQWLIENQSHWVRDVTFDEDRSQVRVGHIPEILAALRNTTIGLMCLVGETNIAAACRRFAAQPWSALTLLGIRLEN